MKKKLVKNILIALVLVAGLVLGLVLVKRTAVYLSKAREEKAQPADGLVQVTNLAQDRATLVWETKEPVMSVVLFGINQANLFQTQAEVAKASSHQVLLTNLLPETTYYFKIQVGDKIFDQNGSPYSFTTLASSLEEEITEEEIRNALGTKESKYDLNQDGIVNLLDVFLFQQESK